MRADQIRADMTTSTVVYETFIYFFAFGSIDENKAWITGATKRSFGVQAMMIARPFAIIWLALINLNTFSLFISFTKPEPKKLILFH